MKNTASNRVRLRRILIHIGHLYLSSLTFYRDKEMILRIPLVTKADGTSIIPSVPTTSSVFLPGCPHAAVECQSHMIAKLHEPGCHHVHMVVLRREEGMRCYSLRLALKRQSRGA